MTAKARETRGAVAFRRQKTGAAGDGAAETGGTRGIIRGLHRAAASRLAAPLLAAALALAGGAAAAADLTGGYFGLGDARGMRIEIEAGAEGADVTGRFSDSNGTETDFTAKWVGEGAEGLLSFPKQDVFLRIEDAPSGLVALALPLAEDGTPREGGARKLIFLRDGLAPPAQPDLFLPEPKRADGVVDPDVFIASYPFWSPEGVSNGFAAIGARYRTMLRLYPMLQADVLWKLCAAPGDLASSQRGEALRGQGVDCEALLGTVERLQRKGEFDAWKAAAGAEAQEFMVSAQCARGFIVKKSVCGPAAQRTAKAAVSMKTVGAAIAPFR